MNTLPRLLLLATALCLALAFIWGNTGSSCLEAVHQWHRREQTRRVATHSADTIRLSESEYAALTALDRHEIRYEGRMYDITGVSYSADGVVLSGHYDDFDRELFKLIDAFLGETGGAAQEHRRQLIFVFSGILPEGICLNQSPARGMEITYLLSAPGAPESPLMELPLPPPDRLPLS